MDTYDHDDAVYHLPRPASVIIVELLVIFGALAAIVAAAIWGQQ